jgi:hypothetical protein
VKELEFCSCEEPFELTPFPSECRSCGHCYKTVPGIGDFEQNKLEKLIIRISQLARTLGEL